MDGEPQQPVLGRRDRECPRHVADAADHVTGPVGGRETDDLSRLVADEVAGDAHPHPAERRERDERTHQFDQRLGHLGAGVARLLVALSDQDLEFVEFGSVEREQVGIDAEQPADDVPEVAVVLGALLVVLDVELVEHVDQRRAVRDHRPEQVLLVDRHPPLAVPPGPQRLVARDRNAAVVLDQMADAGVHQPHGAGTLVAQLARIECARLGDVEDELRRLEDTTLRVGLEPRGERQRLHTVVRGVGQRQRREEQTHAELDTETAEELGPVLHPVVVGPLRESGPIVHPLRNVRIDHRRTAVPGGHHTAEHVGRRPIEVVRREFVGLRVALLPQLVELRGVDPAHRSPWYIGASIRALPWSDGHGAGRAHHHPRQLPARQVRLGGIEE